MFVCKTVALLILLNIAKLCDAYKVLLFFPVPGKSHSILGEGYVRHLLEAGHEVTYITPLPLKDPPARLQQVDVSENIKYLPDGAMDIANFLSNKMDSSDFIQFYWLINSLVVGTLETEAFQKFINNPNQHFDAVIVEWLFSELGGGIATVFDCPLIWSASMIPHTNVLSLVDEHLNPAYTVYFMAKDISFSFPDRVYHLWLMIKIRLYKWWHRDTENEAFKKTLGHAIVKRGRDMPHLDEVRYNGSFILGNSHAILGDGVSLPERYKHIGGYHIKDSIKPLSKDLQKIMDDSKDGVIYFSMGSMLRSTQIPEEITKGLLKMFSGLKQTVIWKFERVIPNLPKNVHIFTWAPQESILAHPHCILFITHGGLLSVMEALNQGVPIIGIPFYADQFLNIERAAAKGYGIRIDLNENAPESLNVAIRNIVGNESYRQRAKEYSAIFKNRIIPPGQELVYWVEYVIKTKGAPHLSSPALYVSWYTKLYLDLAFVLVVAFTLIFKISKFIVETVRIDVVSKKKLS